MRNAISGGFPAGSWGGQFMCVKFCNPKVKSKRIARPAIRMPPRETSFSGVGGKKVITLAISPRHIWEAGNLVGGLRSWHQSSPKASEIQLRCGSSATLSV
jgi:hypothetical protein